MCQEDGANLELAYGPGLTGIINIGSSCYISAVSIIFCFPTYINYFLIILSFCFVYGLVGQF